MTVVNPPAWLQQGTYPARTDRLVMGSVVSSSGRVSASDMIVTQSSTPGMRVTVSAGKAWILGTSVSYQGVYNLVNDGPIDVNIAASSTINPRKDIIVGRIQDAAVSGSTNLGSIEVITGTASSSPVTPTVPANSIVLAEVLVAANASAIVTANIDRTMAPVAAFFSEMVKSTVVCTSTTRPTGSQQYVGLSIFETDTLREWMWTGSNWSYRGGGPGPSAGVGGTAALAWGNTSGLVYNMAPLAGFFDTAYYSFVNGTNTSTGDRIKVTQSGRYAVQIAVFTDKVGAYYAEARPRFNPSSVPLFAHQADGNAGGWGKLTTTTVIYLEAGAEVSLEVYMNSAGTVLAASWIAIHMIP